MSRMDGKHDPLCASHKAPEDYAPWELCDCERIARIREDEALDLERLLMKKLRSDMIRYLSEYGAATQVPADYVIRFFDER